MSDMLKIGMNSLLAYQSALTVTSQNMSNVSTPYYSRRVIEFGENVGYNGISVADVNRIFDSSASTGLQNSNSSFGLSNTLLQQLTQLESQLDSNTNSVGTYINNTLAQLRNLNNSVDNNNSRALFLDTLNILSTRFNSVSAQLQTQQHNVNADLSSTVNTINQLTQQIAAVNNEIFNSSSDDISSLLDTQESLLQNLAQYCDFTRQVNPNGTTNVILGNGTLIIASGNAFQLDTAQDATNPQALDIVLKNQTSVLNVTNAFQSGELVGLIKFQNETLIPTQCELDRLAMAIAYKFNAQNNLGMDGYGNLGSDIFNDVNSASEMNNRAIRNSNNTGSEVMTVSIADPTKITQYTYDLSFDTSSHYVLTRSDGTQVSSGNISSLPQTISVDGFDLNINTGTIDAGDSFTIIPCNGYAGNMQVLFSDPKKLALGWPVTTSAGTQNLGTGQISVTNITDTTTSAFSTPGQLTPPLQIQFLSATQYQLIDTTNNSVFLGPFTYDPQNGSDIFPTPAPSNYDPGYRIHLSGTIQAGDVFNIQYSTSATGAISADNRNGIAMDKMFLTSVIDGSLTFSGGYDKLANDVANQTNGATINYTSSQILQQQAQSNFEQISGVSMDEEYVNLTQYQQAYQASAQIIDVAKNIFDVIMAFSRS